MTDFNPHNATGLRRLVKAFNHSLSGLQQAFEGETAFRQEVVLAFLLMPVAFIVPVDVTQRALLVMSIMMVLVVEMINSAIEATVDRVSLDKHPLAKRAKDMGSAAVLLVLANALLIWSVILWPRGQ